MNVFPCYDQSCCDQFCYIHVDRLISWFAGVSPATSSEQYFCRYVRSTSSHVKERTINIQLKLIRSNVSFLFIFFTAAIGLLDH
jgi:hypothetical protein